MTTAHRINHVAHSRSARIPTVGIIAPVQEPIPGISGTDADMKYGGTERVVASLVKGLSQLGVDVHLFAAGNSSHEIRRLASRFHAIVPKSVRQTPPYDTDVFGRERQTDLAAARALHHAQRFGLDIIHNHIGVGALLANALGGLRIPMVTTLHGYLGLPMERAVYMDDMFRGAPVVSISDNQHKPLPLNYVGTVYNPIPTDIFDPRYGIENRSVWPAKIDMSAGSYLAWLGRFSPEKRPHVAIDVAVRLNMPLVLAGKREPFENEYWEREIAPRLEKHGDLVRYIGEVNDAEKNLLLRGARAFLMPINWQEPFGLVVGESMACGTPVVATAMGSMPEIIADGTGYLVKPCTDETSLVEAFAEKVRLCDSIDRRACRRHVEEKFSIEQCARGYLAVYRRMLGESTMRVAI